MTGQKRTVVTLCGSTRFSQAFQDANLRETLAGNIVLTIGCDMRSDAAVFAHEDDDARAAIKARLDALHRDKIAMSDEILVLNVDGYVGESTRAEVAYATEHGKRVRWLEPERVPEEFARAAMDQRRDWQVVWVQHLLEMAGMTPEPEVLDDELTETEARRMATQRKIEFANAVGMRIWPRLRPGAVEKRLAAMGRRLALADSPEDPPDLLGG